LSDDVIPRLEMPLDERDHRPDVVPKLRGPDTINGIADSREKQQHYQRPAQRRLADG